MPEAISVPGTKVIYHPPNGISLSDDPSYPFKLYARLSPPELMSVAFLLLYGDEEVVVLGRTREALDQFVKKFGLRTNPRLRELSLSGPEGIIEEIK